MPERKTIKSARSAARQGKSATTQAGPFVREEMHHIRGGKHGARSTKQAVAIGLSKARRAGVKVPKSGGKSTSQSGKSKISAGRRPSATRSKAIRGVLKREPRSAASHTSLSRQTHRAAKARGPIARRRAAQKAA